MKRIPFRDHRCLVRDQTRIMAILNVTDDSFSGDGTLLPEEIVARAQCALAEGATILDLGAESTRPGAQAIGQEEELARVLPALKALRAAFPNVILSIDTTKAEVFRQAYAAGADMLNSVVGLPASLREIVAEVSCVVVITNPGGPQSGSVEAVLASLRADVESAKKAGIPGEKLILDPGIGFGKTPDENIALLAALPRLTAGGNATLLGASRKSTLGLLTRHLVDQREFATSATTTMAALAKMDFVRVHHVAAARETLAVANAVGWHWRPEGWS